MKDNNNKYLVTVILLSEIDSYNQLGSFKIHQKNLDVLYDIFYTSTQKIETLMYTYALNYQSATLIFNLKDLRAQLKFCLNINYDPENLNSDKLEIIKLIKYIKSLIREKTRHQKETTNHFYEYTKNNILFDFNFEEFNIGSYYGVNLSIPVYRALMAKIAKTYMIPIDTIYRFYKQGLKNHECKLSLNDLNLSAIKYFQDNETIVKNLREFLRNFLALYKEKLSK